MPGKPDDPRDRDELERGVGRRVLELFEAICAVSMPKVTSSQELIAAENDHPQLVSIAVTARSLSLSRASVQRLLREGLLTLLKVGGRRLVECASISAFIKRQKERPANTRASDVSRHETISTGAISDLSSAGAHRTRKLRAR